MPIHPENVTIIYIPENRSSKHRESNLTETKGEIDISTVIVWGFL